MSTLGMISLACLVITGSLAGWAIFSQHFDDTLLQRIGLSIVAIACGTRAWERITNFVPDPPLPLLWSQIGLAAYAIGTAWRLYKHRLEAGEERRKPMRRRGVGV